jgi:branched-chain amino acid transport system permease protein
MVSIIDILVQGTLLGGLYALFAAGLSLVFGVMRLVNLAHGDIIVLASFLILVVGQSLGLNLAMAAALAIAIMFGSGFALQVGLLNRVLGRDILPPVLTTFGLSIIIQNGLLQGFSADTRRLAAPEVETASFPLGAGLAVGLVPLLTFASAILVILSLNALVFRTSVGRAFRAISDDPVTAQLMGIDYRRLFGIATGLAFAIATIAALCLGIRTNFDPSIGPSRLIFGFEAVIIGGLGSLWGTLAGGIALGIAQTGGAAISPGWQILSGHLVFLMILAMRPRGLFPRAQDKSAL